MMEMLAQLMFVIHQLDHVFTLQRPALQRLLVKLLTVTTFKDVFQHQEIVMITFHALLILVIVN
jgi:hypothetical protein